MVVDATVGLVVLAGGASTRMGRPKVAVLLAGETFLHHALAAYAPHPVSPVLIVSGAHREAVESEAGRHGIRHIGNPSWENGMFSSVRTGVAELLALESDAHGIFVHPVDCPLVTADTIAAMCSRFAEDPSRCVVPSHGGQTGHPVLLNRETAQAVLSAPASHTLRDVMSAPTPFTCEVDDPNILLNFNTMDEVDSWVDGGPGGRSYGARRHRLSVVPVGEG